MRNLPVHWNEGLFLRPQHFQAADRYWAESIQTSQQWNHPYGYGIHSLEISTEALANRQFQVHSVHARTRDGALLSLDIGQEPDRIDLSRGNVGSTSVSLAEAFDQESVIDVFLGIPKLRLGRKNVDTSESSSTARYLAVDQVIHDENLGGNDQTIQFRVLNTKLLLSTQDLSGYELVPLARIKRSSETEAAPELDPTFIPPVLSINASQVLGRDIIRATYDVIGRKIEVLSQQIVNRGIGLNSQDPGDSERILMLTQLNAAYGVLAVLTSARGVHPFVAYTEMCRILGQLSIFGESCRVPDVPLYNHDNLYEIFQHLRLEIELLINSVRDYEYRQRFFVGVGMGLQATLEPQWFHSNWQWYIGVRKGDLTEQEVRDLLSTGQLDWKFGSSRQVEMLFRQRATGVQLAPLDRPIRALPARQDWVYYIVPHQDTPAWRDVQETQTLSVRVKDSLIMNLDRLQGERQLVVSAWGRNIPLEFALFAVPEQS